MHARNMRESVARIQEGLPVAAAFALKEALGLTNAGLAGLLGVTARTLARWDEKGRLDPVSGDRLDRAARLLETAVAVLEDEGAAASWLRRPQRALGGAIPIELASTDIGTRAVEALLGRMEHGVYT